MVQRIGIVGCGNISDIYIRNLRRFGAVRLAACADVHHELARSKAELNGIAAIGVDELVASGDVDIILNLTPPAVHAEVSLRCLAAGKHVYSEKPLATTLADGQAIVALAESKGLRVGVAPDTILGAAAQKARRLIDEGAIGQPILGTAAVLSHGMEAWHPNPAFFFQAGGGPVLDMGPYYVASLVSLLGPVGTVRAVGRIGNPRRVVGARESPRFGESIDVSVPTSTAAILSFESGCDVTFVASWDVWRHGLPPIELHGTEGSIRLPDPNWFGGDLLLSHRGVPWQTLATEREAFGRSDFRLGDQMVANYRGLGLVDMAHSIESGRPHRLGGSFGLHVLAVLTAIQDATATGGAVSISIGAERPAPMDRDEAIELSRPV